MSAVDREPGSTEYFGHYRLDRVLGEGGFGRVRAAWDERLQRWVAIKFVEGDHGRRDGLRREAQRSASQPSPAFVTVHAIEEHHGTVGMVMELVRGRTLAQRIDEDGALPVACVLRLGRQAAAALAEAHRSGWAHGDIKPSNLMLDETGTLRILDFGASAAFDPIETASLSSADGPSGTLAYLPPERLLGARIAASGDIYALGLVLYEALTGDRGRGGEQDWGALHRRLWGDRGGLRLPAGFEDDLGALIERMTRRLPNARPESMLAVHDALSRLIEGAMPQATSAGRRHRLGRGVVILVLAGLLAGVASYRALDPGSDTARAQGVPAPAIQIAAAERRLADFDRPGAIAEATTRLEAVLADAPSHASAAALLAIAHCLRYAGDERDEIWLKRAEEASSLALRSEPQLALAHAARGWSEEYLGRNDAAEAHYRRALTLDPNDRYALLGLARLYSASNRETQAAAVLRDALTRHPRERWFHDTLGTLAYRQGDLAGAERAFRRSIAIKPDGLQAYVSLGGILLRQDRSEDALTVLQQGMRHGTSSTLYSNLGTVLFTLGRYAEAAEAFEQAVSASKGSPNDYLQWANLGDALRWLPGREAEAKTAYQSALRIAEELMQRYPDSATLASRAALYAARLGRFDRAGSHTATALARAGDDPDILFRAALVAELSGNRDAALERLRRAIEKGYPQHMIAGEPDLLALRRDRRYHSLLQGEQR